MSPKITAATVSSRRKPPPEKPEAINLRTTVIVSFWIVILLLGLPTWWQTTSIYRADLPLTEMLQRADGPNGIPTSPIEIWVSIQDLICGEADQLVREAQQALDDLNEFPVIHQRLRLVQSVVPLNDASPIVTSSCGEDALQISNIEPALKIFLRPTGETFSLDLQRGSSNAVVQYSTKARSSLPSDLAKSLQALFIPEQVATALQVINYASNSHNAQAFLKSQPHELVTEIEKQISRAFKSSPKYHLTFSLFTASGAPSSWDIQAALANHIEPLLQALSGSAQFSVATQIQLYSSYSPSVPLFVMQGRNGTFLKQHDLTAFVNAAEWPLSPSIGDGPTVNFIMYIPTNDHIPMILEGTENTSWLIPQWGGITILNPPLVPHPVKGVLSIPVHFSADVIQSAFEGFSAQLLLLMGVLPSEIHGLSLPLPMRLGAFKRLSVLTLQMKASSTLGSLARLAQHLSSIPIPKHVAQLVDNAMTNITASSNAVSESRWDQALEYAISAYQDSEKAFFDKAMVGQVYFPDEHKVAVYLPLLGPIGVPLLVGLIREVKRLVVHMKSRKS